METILEEPEEYSKRGSHVKLKTLWDRYHRSTYLVNDCSSLLFFILFVIILSYSVLSDNLLDVFHFISHDSQSIAAAYVTCDGVHSFVDTSANGLATRIHDCWRIISRLCLWSCAIACLFVAWL